MFPSHREKDSRNVCQLAETKQLSQNVPHQHHKMRKLIYLKLFPPHSWAAFFMFLHSCIFIRFLIGVDEEVLKCFHSLGVTCFSGRLDCSAAAAAAAVWQATLCCSLAAEIQLSAHQATQAPKCRTLSALLFRLMHGNSAKMVLKEIVLTCLLPIKVSSSFLCFLAGIQAHCLNPDTLYEPREMWAGSSGRGRGDRGF